MCEFISCHGQAETDSNQLSTLRSATTFVSRAYSSSVEPDLKATLREIIPEKRELMKKVKAQGNKIIGDVKIENTFGGMRSVYLR